jgi:hypothetical protein
VNGQNIEELDMGKAYRELADRFADMPTVRVKSDGAAWLKMIGDGKPGVLDWVYIDTDHEYETLRQELHEARRAVKEGGLICGHDYARESPGVIEAVNEFAMEYGLKVQLYAGDRLPSFKIVNTK